MYLCIHVHVYIHAYACCIGYTQVYRQQNEVVTKRRCDWEYMYMVVTYMLMRDEKEGRKKQARSNKQQGKATQHTQGSHFPKEKRPASGGNWNHDTQHSRCTWSPTRASSFLSRKVTALDVLCCFALSFDLASFLLSSLINICLYIIYSSTHGEGLWGVCEAGCVSWRGSWDHRPSSPTAVHLWSVGQQNERKSHSEIKLVFMH